MITAGTILQNRYLIEKQIGTGGMGRVYVAVDRRFENRVAIKETFYKDEGLREAFEREARLLNGLHHPVLPHVSDYFTEGSEYFLVMEYIEGDDLHEILKRDGEKKKKKVLRWSEQMLDALDYLHSQNPPIIHRDIKPQNLKITARGDVVLLDFGLAKLNADDTTGAVSVFGYSRAYSPLEQIQGTGTDARSDIFALAATAFHLLTGKQPIDVLSRAAAIIGGNQDPLQRASELRSEIPASVDQILQKALSLNPSERFASAKEVLQTLKAALNDSVLAIDFPENTAQKMDEVENFPALQEFAKTAANSLTQPNAAAESDNQSFQFSDLQKTNLTKSVSPQKTVAEDNFHQSRRKNLSWMMIGVLAAVILGGTFAAWQFSGKSKASSETLPATVPSSAADIKTAAVSPQIETPKSAPAADSAQAESSKQESPATNSDGADKKPSESRQAVVRAETPAKTKPVSASKENAPSKNQAERPRVVEEEEPLPDIEAIFTGQTRQQRAEQQRRRAQREERRRERRRRMRDRIDDWELPPPRRRRNDW